jgi:hypothetical protein
VVDGVDRGPVSVLAALSAASPPTPISRPKSQFPTAGAFSDMSPEEEALQVYMLYICCIYVVYMCMY